jgi:hypothetical protein
MIMQKNENLLLAAVSPAKRTSSCSVRSSENARHNFRFWPWSGTSGILLSKPAALLADHIIKSMWRQFAGRSRLAGLAPALGWIPKHEGGNFTRIPAVHGSLTNFAFGITSLLER